MRNGNGTPAAHLSGLPVFLRAPRAAGLWLVGVLIALASVVAFGLSYRGLFEWAVHHQWPVAVAVFFPLLIDVLIVVCEVILFVAAIDGGTPWHVRALAWLVLLVFTGLSVVGNADHAATANALTRGGFALPPLVLAVALGFGLGELKRQSAKYRGGPPVASEPVRVTEGRPPSEWLDDQILALLRRMSVRSTAEALGVSKTRVETAKRRAALPVPDEHGRGAAPTAAPATQVTQAGAELQLIPQGPNGRPHG